MLLVEETLNKFGYHIDDLSTFSRKKVLVKCDFCDEVIPKPFSNYNIQRKMSDLDSCMEHRGLKQSLTKKTISGVKDGYRKCCICKEEKELNEENFHWDSKEKNMFKYMCKTCNKEQYHSNKNLITDQIFSLEESIKIYNDAICNSKSLLPYSFFERVENIKGLLDYIFKIKTDMYQSKFKNFNNKFINKYKLYYVVRKFKTIYNFINYYYPDSIKPWDITPQGYWDNDENKRTALNWFVSTLLYNKVIDSIDELPKVCSYRLFEKHGFGGLVANYFNSSPYLTLNFLYPSKFNEWEFKQVSNSFYKLQENRQKIMEWFIEQLLKDKIIHSIEGIPSKININTFRKYKIYKFLSVCHSGVSFRAFDEIYPNKWRIWEFKSCPNGFWENKENINDAIKWFTQKLIDDGIIDEIKGLKDVQISKLLSEYSLSSLTKDSSKMYEYLIDTYPDVFTKELLKINEAKDGTKCLSRPEVLIHNLFLENGMNFKYGSKRYRFKNELFNESYLPDWVIKTKEKNYIVEYFGLYTKKGTSKILKDYREKTHRKLDYYKGLVDYGFVGIYVEDLKNNYNGLIQKFSKIGIQLDIEKREFSKI
jgi:hypothetical protein